MGGILFPCHRQYLSVSGSNPRPLAIMLMRYLPIFLLTLLLISCFGNKQSFDKVFYEKTTRIKFPEKCFVLEAFDNGEFLTGAVFDVDSLSFQNFIVTNSFDTVKSLLDVNILSKNYLTKNKPMFHSTRNLFFKRKVEQDHYWIFIADLNSKRLWTEIKYPDWSGQ